MGKSNQGRSDWFTDEKKYGEKLDEFVDFSKEVGKPMIASECCWGSYDDKVRGELVDFGLKELNKRKIGWLAVSLHHSLQADEHRKEYGPCGGPGNLSFIEANGSLRPYHEIALKYM
jgi:hypothetical protein